MPERPTLSRLTEARRLSEALPGGRTFAEVEALLCDELRETFGTDEWSYVWLRDLTDEWVAYEVDGETYKVAYSMDDAGVVTFTGTPEPVEVRVSYDPEPPEPADGEVVTPLAESRLKGTGRARVAGRVLESKGEAADGGRIFRVQVIEAGISRNGARYSEAVLQKATPLYDGVKAFDHHRTPAEMATSTVAGLAGHYRNPSWSGTGIDADLHLLPSATHVAESLQASLDAQEAGLAPVVGISHDVEAYTTPKVEGGRRILEATEIVSVLSADVVADPSAGGRVTRLVAGGTSSTNTSPQEDTTMTLKQLLALLRSAAVEDRAALLEEHAAVIEASGYSADEITALIPVEGSADDQVGDTAEEHEGELASVSEAYQRDGIMGRTVIREAVAQAGLDDGMIPLVASGLPERITEADVTRGIEAFKRMAEGLERSGLRPRAGHIEVGQEERDKKADKLLESFRGNYQEGYSRLSEAYFDISGRPASDMFNGGDIAREIIRESWTAVAPGQRLTESLSVSSWGEVLADVMNKRVVETFQGRWQDWRLISSIVPVNDFRSQKLIQVSEYASLPTVNEGAPYQPLTSPTDKQETYSPTKKGGTDDFTYEAARNDDLRQLVSIPTRLGRLVAFTIYNTVFGVLSSNPTLGDSIALFNASHGNTAAVALSQTNLSSQRQKMRDQTAYGDSTRPLGLTPKYLVVPNELEELAFQLCTSAVAVPATAAGPSNTPNIHQATGLQPIVADVLTDSNDWFLVADPSMNPAIEVGFLDGKVDPELFVNDDPTQGSTFSADKVTFKVRSIWGYAVVDYRSFQRGTQ